MAKGRNSKPKKTPPLMKQFSNDPIATSKRQWAKLPGVAKIAVILAGMGATGIGAAQVIGFGRIGQAVAPVVNWGAKLRGKLGR